MLTVMATIMTITGRSVCSTNSDVTIPGRSICSVNSYHDKNENNGDGLYALLTVM